MGMLPDRMHLKQPMQLMCFQVLLGTDTHESTIKTCMKQHRPHHAFVTFQARLAAALFDLAICFAVRELDRLPIM